MERKLFLAIDRETLHRGGNAALPDIIATHATTEELAYLLDHSLMLVFEGDRPVSVVETGRKAMDQSREILPTGDLENIRYPDNVHHPVNIRLTNTETKSYLGGYKPYEVKMPVDGPVSFQYLGFVSKDESIFQGTGFEIDLIFPVYGSVKKVFIDYSDPGLPLVLNAEELEKSTTSHDEYVNRHTVIDYLKQRLIFHPAGNDSDESPFASSSVAGIPLWKDVPSIPHCPKSGRRMLFLMQISPELARQVPVRYSNIRLKEPKVIERVGRNGDIDYIFLDRPEEECYKYMNFHGNGTLYIFYEPESKVVCYFIQNNHQK